MLAGGVLLSLAANLDQAQPSAWGRIMAATPCAAFLIAVSMLERRTSTRRHSPAAPVPPPVPGPGLGSPSPAGRSPAVPAAALLDSARRAAAEHQTAHGQPITRDALRARLSVSNQRASSLLRQIRAPRPAQPPASATTRQQVHDPGGDRPVTSKAPHTLATPGPHRR